jgi:hypothetical protein
MEAMRAEALGLDRELILIEKSWRVLDGFGATGLVRGELLIIVMGLAVMAGGGFGGGLGGVIGSWA